MSPPIKFVVGNPNVLTFPNVTFASYRTEHVLQDLDDPGQGLA